MQRVLSYDVRLSDYPYRAKIPSALIRVRASGRSGDDLPKVDCTAVEAKSYLRIDIDRRRYDPEEEFCRRPKRDKQVHWYSKRR